LRPVASLSSHTPVWLVPQHPYRLACKMPATLLHRRPYGGASPAAIIHSACSPSPHPRRSYHISGHRSGTVTSELQWRDDKRKRGHEGLYEFPNSLLITKVTLALVTFALLLEMLSTRQSVQNGHFQRLLLCEVLHTRWKAKLLGSWGGAPWQRERRQ
jgi:hypothetical protein